MSAPMPAHVVTREQLIELVRLYDPAPETVTQVVLDVREITVTRRRPSHETLVAPLLDALGLDPYRVTRVVIDPDRIHVTEHRLDEHGRAVRDGDELATVTTTIGIQ